MSWLKKLGEVAKVGSSIIPVWGPLISAVIPGEKDDKILARVDDTWSQIAGVVVTAEQMGAAIKAPGVQKLDMAAPSVAQLILRSSALAGKKVKDAAKFEAAVKGVASNVADLLSALEA